MPGTSAILADVSEETVKGFCSLKDVLKAIHNDPEVLLATSSQNSRFDQSILQQGTITVKNKIEGLCSSIVALEIQFDSPPGTIAELRNRNGLIRYHTIDTYSPLGLDSLSASSGVSKGSYDCRLRHPARSPLVIKLDVTGTFLGASRNCGRPSLVTRFVRWSGSLVDVDEYNS